MSILSIILQSYSSILIAIGCAAIAIFMLGLYFIIRLSRNEAVSIESHSENVSDTPSRKQKHRPEKITPSSVSDVSAISAEDPIATQLDLAKAYIESGKNPLARIILNTVIKNGHAAYQEEAQRLLSSI